MGPKNSEPRLSRSGVSEASGAPPLEGGASIGAEDANGYDVLTAKNLSVVAGAKREIPRADSTRSWPAVSMPVVGCPFKFPEVGTCSSFETQVKSRTSECLATAPSLALDVGSRSSCWAERYRRRFVSPLHSPEAPRVSKGMRKRLLQFNFLDLVDATLDALAFQTPVASSLPHDGFQSCPSFPWFWCSSLLVKRSQTSSSTAAGSQGLRSTALGAAPSSARDWGTFEDSGLSEIKLPSIASPNSSLRSPAPDAEFARERSHAPPLQQDTPRSCSSSDLTVSPLGEEAPSVSTRGRSGESGSSHRAHASHDRATCPDSCAGPSMFGGESLGDTRVRSDDRSTLGMAAKSDNVDELPDNRPRLVRGGGRGRRSSPRPRVGGRYGLRQRDKINDANVATFLSSSGTHPLHEAMAWHLRRPWRLRKTCQSVDCVNPGSQGEEPSMGTRQVSDPGKGMSERGGNARAAEAVSGGDFPDVSEQPSDDQTVVAGYFDGLVLNHQASFVSPSSSPPCTDCGSSFAAAEVCPRFTATQCSLAGHSTVLNRVKRRADFGWAKPPDLKQQVFEGQRECARGSAQQREIQQESAGRLVNYGSSRIESSTTMERRKASEDTGSASSEVRRIRFQGGTRLPCSNSPSDMGNDVPPEETQRLPRGSLSLSLPYRFSDQHGKSTGLQVVNGWRPDMLGVPASFVRTSRIEPESIPESRSFHTSKIESPGVDRSPTAPASSLLALKTSPVMNISHTTDAWEPLPLHAEAGDPGHCFPPAATIANQLSVFPSEAIRTDKTSQQYFLPFPSESAYAHSRQQPDCLPLPRTCPLPHQGFSGFSSFIELKRLKSRPDPKKHVNPSAPRKPKCMNTAFLPLLRTAAPPPIADVFLPDLELFRREVYDLMAGTASNLLPSFALSDGAATAAEDRKPEMRQSGMLETEDVCRVSADHCGFISDALQSIRCRDSEQRCEPSDVFFSEDAAPRLLPGERTAQERTSEVPGCRSLAAAAQEGTPFSPTANPQRIPGGACGERSALWRPTDPAGCCEGIEKDDAATNSSFGVPCGGIYPKSPERAKVQCPRCGREKSVLPQHFYHVAIIGGGIAGLTAASILKLFNCRVLLIEASARLGGRINTQYLPAVYMSCPPPARNGVCHQRLCPTNKGQDDTSCASEKAKSREFFFRSPQAESGGEKPSCGLGMLSGELRTGGQGPNPEECGSKNEAERVGCSLPAFFPGGTSGFVPYFRAGKVCPAHHHLFPEDSFAEANKKMKERKARKRSKYWVFIEEDMQSENIAGDEKTDTSTLQRRRRLTAEELAGSDVGTRQKRQRKVPADFQDFHLYGTNSAVPNCERGPSRFSPSSRKAPTDGGSSHGERDTSRARRNGEGNSNLRLARKAGPRRGPGPEAASLEVAEGRSEFSGCVGGLPVSGRSRTRSRRATDASPSVSHQDDTLGRGEEGEFQPGKRFQRGGRGGRRGGRESVGTGLSFKTASPATARRGRRRSSCSSVAQKRDGQNGNPRRIMERRKSPATCWQSGGISRARAADCPRTAPSGAATPHRGTAGEGHNVGSESTSYPEDVCSSIFAGKDSGLGDTHSNQVLTRCDARIVSVTAPDFEGIEDMSRIEMQPQTTPVSSSAEECESDLTNLPVLADARDHTSAVTGCLSRSCAPAGTPRGSSSSRGESCCWSCCTSSSGSFSCSCTSTRCRFLQSLSGPLLPAIPVDLGANWLMFDMDSPQYVWQLASLLQVPSSGLWGPGGNAGEKGGPGGTSGAVWEPMVFGTRWIDGGGRTVNYARVALLSDVKDAVLERVRLAFLRQRRENAHNQADTLPEETEKEAGGSSEPGDRGKGENEDREMKAEERAGAGQERAEEGCTKQRGCCTIAEKSRAHERVPKARRGCRKKREERSVREEGSEEKQTTSPTGAEARSAKAVFSRTSTPQRNTNNQDYVTLRLRAKKEKREPSSQLRHRPSRCCEGTTNGGTLTVECTKPRLTSENSPQKVVVDRSQSSIPPFHPLGLLCPPFLATRRPEEKRGSAIADEKRTTMEPMLAEISPVRIYTAAVISASIYTKLPPLVLARIALMLPPFPLDPLGRPDANAAGADKRQPPCNFALQYLPLFPTASLHCLPSSLAARLLPPSETCQLPAGSVPVSPSCVIPSPTDSASLSAKAKPAEPVPPQLGGSSGALPSSLQQLETSTSPSTKAKSGSSSAPADIPAETSSLLSFEPERGSPCQPQHPRSANTTPAPPLCSSGSSVIPSGQQAANSSSLTTPIVPSTPVTGCTSTDERRRLAFRDPGSSEDKPLDKEIARAACSSYTVVSQLNTLKCTVPSYSSPPGPDVGVPERKEDRVSSNAGSPALSSDTRALSDTRKEVLSQADVQLRFPLPVKDSIAQTAPFQASPSAPAVLPIRQAAVTFPEQNYLWKNALSSAAASSSVKENSEMSTDGEGATSPSQGGPGSAMTSQAALSRSEVGERQRRILAECIRRLHPYPLHLLKIAKIFWLRASLYPSPAAGHNNGRLGGPKAGNANLFSLFCGSPLKLSCQLPRGTLTRNHGEAPRLNLPFPRGPGEEGSPREAEGETVGDSYGSSPPGEGLSGVCSAEAESLKDSFVSSHSTVSWWGANSSGDTRWFRGKEASEVSSRTLPEADGVSKKCDARVSLSTDRGEVPSGNDALLHVHNEARDHRGVTGCSESLSRRACGVFCATGPGDESSSESQKWAELLSRPLPAFSPSPKNLCVSTETEAGATVNGSTQKHVRDASGGLSETRLTTALDVAVLCLSPSRQSSVHSSKPVSSLAQQTTFALGTPGVPAQVGGSSLGQCALTSLQQEETSRRSSDTVTALTADDNDVADGGGTLLGVHRGGGVNPVCRDGRTGGDPTGSGRSAVAHLDGRDDPAGASPTEKNNNVRKCAQTAHAPARIVAVCASAGNAHAAAVSKQSAGIDTGPSVAGSVGAAVGGSACTLAGSEDGGATEVRPTEAEAVCVSASPAENFGRGLAKLKQPDSACERDTDGSVSTIVRPEDSGTTQFNGDNDTAATAWCARADAGASGMCATESTPYRGETSDAAGRLGGGEDLSVSAGSPADDSDCDYVGVGSGPCLTNSPCLSPSSMRRTTELAPPSSGFPRGHDRRWVSPSSSAETEISPRFPSLSASFTMQHHVDSGGPVSVTTDREEGSLHSGGDHNVSSLEQLVPSLPLPKLPPVSKDTLPGAVSPPEISSFPSSETARLALPADERKPLAPAPAEFVSEAAENSCLLVSGVKTEASLCTSEKNPCCSTVVEKGKGAQKCYVSGFLSPGSVSKLCSLDSPLPLSSSLLQGPPLDFSPASTALLKSFGARQNSSSVSSSVPTYSPEDCCDTPVEGGCTRSSVPSRPAHEASLPCSPPTSDLRINSEEDPAPSAVAPSVACDLSSSAASDLFLPGSCSSRLRDPLPLLSPAASLLVTAVASDAAAVPSLSTVTAAFETGCAGTMKLGGTSEGLSRASTSFSVHAGSLAPSLSESSGGPAPASVSAASLAPVFSSADSSPLRKGELPPQHGSSTARHVPGCSSAGASCAVPVSSLDSGESVPAASAPGFVSLGACNSSHPPFRSVCSRPGSEPVCSSCLSTSPARLTPGVCDVSSHVLHCSTSCRDAPDTVRSLISTPVPLARSRASAQSSSITSETSSKTSDASPRSSVGMVREFPSGEATDTSSDPSLRSPTSSSSSPNPLSPGPVVNSCQAGSPFRSLVNTKSITGPSSGGTPAHGGAPLRDANNPSPNKYSLCPQRQPPAGQASPSQSSDPFVSLLASPIPTQCSLLLPTLETHGPASRRPLSFSAPSEQKELGASCRAEAVGRGESHDSKARCDSRLYASSELPRSAPRGASWKYRTGGGFRLEGCHVAECKIDCTNLKTAVLSAWACIRDHKNLPPGLVSFLQEKRTQADAQFTCRDTPLLARKPGRDQEGVAEAKKKKAFQPATYVADDCQVLGPGNGGDSEVFPRPTSEGDERSRRRVNEVNSVKPERAKSTSPSTPCSAVGCSTGGLRRSECSSRVDQLAMSDALVHKCGRQATLEDTSLGPSVSVRTSCRPAAGTTGETYADVEKRLSLPGGGDSSQRGKFTASLQGISETSVGKRAEHVGVLSRKRRAPTAKGRGGVLELKPEDSGPTATLQEDSFSDCQSKGASRDKRRRTKQDAHLMCREGQTVVKVTQEDKVLESSPRSSPSDLDNFSAETPGDRQLPSQGSPCSEGASLLCTSSSPETSSPYKLSALSHLERVARPIPGAEIFPVSWSAQVDLRQQDAQAGGDNESPSAAGGEAFLRQPAERRENRAGSEAVGGSSFSRLTSSRYWEKADEEIILKMVQRSFGYVCDLAEVSVEDLVGGSDEDAEEVSIKIPEGLLRGKTMRSGVAECRKSEKPGKTDYSAKQCVKKENEKNSSALRSGAADGIGERRQTISGTVEKSVATRGQSDQGQPYETKAKGKTAGRQASDKHDAMGPGVITEEDQGTTNKKKGDGKRSRRSHFPFLTPENYKQLGSRESTLLARRRLDGTPTPHMFEPEAADGDRLFADGYKWLPTLLIQTFGLLDCAVLGYQARHISLVPAKCEDSARVMESNSQLPSLLSDWTSKLPCHSPERREDSLQDASQHEGQSKGRKNKPSDGNDSSSSEVESDVETACTILKSALGFSGMDKSTRVDCGSATATRIDQFGLETPGGYSRNLKVLSGSLRTLPGEETEQHASEESGMTCRSTVLPEKAHTETEFHVGCSAKTHGSDRESTSTHSRDGIPGSSVAEELESHEAYVNACANDPLYWPWVGLPYSGVRISLRRYYNNVEGGRRADTQLDMQASLSACGGNNGDTERCASALTSGKAQKEEQSLPSVAGPQRCFASAPASLPLSGGRVEEPAAGVAEHAEARERTELSGCKRKEEKDEKTRIADPGKKVCSEKEQTDSEDERVPPKGVLEKVKGSQLPGRTDGQETERNVPTAVPVGEPRNGENETTEREGNVTGAGDNRTGTIATPILRQQDTVNREDSIREERQPRDHTDEQEEEDSTGGRHTEVALAAGVQGPLLYAPEEQNPQCLPKQESSGSGPKRDQATSKQNVSQIESEAATRKHDKYESSSCECMYAEDVYALKCIVAVPIGVLKKNVITFSPPLSSEKQAAIRRWGAGSHNKVVLRFTEVFWPPSAPFLNPSFTPLFQFMNLHAFGKANCLVAHSFGNYRWDFVRRLRERRKVRRSARRKSTGSRGDCFLLDFPSKRVTGSLFQSEAETKRESGVMGRIDNMAGGNDETASVADTENLAAVTSCPWVRGTMQESSGGFTCESRATEEASRKSACFSEQHRNGNAQLPLPQRVSGTDPTIEVPCCGAALRSSRSRSDLGGGGQSSHFSGHSVDDQPSHGKKSDNESELDGTLSSAEDDWDEADHWELWAERNEVSSSGQKNHTRKRVSDQEVVDECCLVLKRMFNLKKKPWPVQAIVTRWDEDPLYYCSYGFPSKETQERDQQLLSQPHPWAPSVPLPVKKFLRPADRPLGGKGKEKGLGNQSGCCDATEAMENKRCSPGENERPRTSKSTKSKGGCRNAPDGLLEAQFVNSLSDSLVYFCGEHTSDFGQQCVHGAMHSGARAAAECLASLLKCDGVPWCQSDWGLTQNMGTEGPSTRSADPDCGCSPGRSSEDVRLSETADERAAYGSGKDFSLRKGTRTESGYAAAHRSKAQDDVGTTVIDEWKTWWYGSDGAFVYGRDGSATHSAPRDVFLRKALTREQRVGILRRRISEFVNAMGANEDASESA